MSEQNYKEILEHLKGLFPGRAMINRSEYAKALGLAEKTVSNQLYRDKCLVKPKRVGGRPFWIITKMARTLAEM